MLKKRFIFVLLLGSAAVSIILLSQRNLDYIKIPIQFYPSENTPALNIEVEGKKYLVLLDLGANKSLSLRRKIINGIKDKKFSKTLTSYDLKGNTYSIQSYIVPKIKLKSLDLNDIKTTVDSVDFLIEGGDPYFEINKKTSNLARKRADCLDGSIGRNLLKEWNCFFDFPNQVIYLVKKQQQKIPFELDDFTVIPFQMHKYGILIPLNSDLGTHKFVLDTGSTHSSIRESIVDPSNTNEFTPRAYITDSVVIGGKDMGEWKFSLRRISEKFKEIDGILGADFFLQHAIYLDFAYGLVYIGPRANREKSLTNITVSPL